MDILTLVAIAHAFAMAATLISLADPIAVGVLVAAVAVTTVVAVVVVVVAVSGGTGRRRSYCCGTDRRSAIRIPATIGNPTIGCPAIRSASIGRPAIGHATARNANGAASDTCRANSPASTDATATVSECVIGNKGRSHEDGGCETYEDVTQHWCSPSLGAVPARNASD
jgi:hypothetical protein